MADEVRALAGKSAEAAQNTNELITNSINTVDGGSEISDATAASLKQVIEIAHRVYGIMQEIVVLSQTQADEVNLIADGIRDMAGAVQLNSTTAQESAEASRELSEQAQTMKKLVSRFRIS